MSGKRVQLRCGICTRKTENRRPFLGRAPTFWAFALNLNTSALTATATSTDATTYLLANSSPSAAGGLYRLTMRIRGQMCAVCDLCRYVLTKSRQRLQEMHITVGHRLRDFGGEDGEGVKKEFKSARMM